LQRKNTDQTHENLAQIMFKDSKTKCYGRAI